MSDWNIRRKDAIEEETQRLHDIVEYELRQELESNYREQFGPVYVADHPFEITDGVAFERLVIERMRKNAQPPKKANP